MTTLKEKLKKRKIKREAEGAFPKDLEKIVDPKFRKRFLKGKK